MRRQRYRHGSVGVFKARTFGSQRIDVRRADLPVAVASQVVRPQCVYGDDHNVKGGLALGPQPRADEEKAGYPQECETPGGDHEQKKLYPRVNAEPGADNVSDYASLSGSEGPPRTADLLPYCNLERCPVTTKEGGAARDFPGNR